MPALRNPAHALPAISAQSKAALVAAQVPLADCSSCPELFEDEDEAEGLDYPKGFDVDLTEEMLGSVKNYGRQVLISTGKSDWIREVTDDSSSLAGFVKSAHDSLPTLNGSGSSSGLFGKLTRKFSGGGKGEDEEGPVPGVHRSSVGLEEGERPHSRLSILNSSFVSGSHEGGVESVIVLPDFKVVENVAESLEGAKDLVDGYLKPGVGRGGDSPLTKKLRSWPLPYHAVVLLCSHKKRDKRCHIAAPLLAAQFHHHLEKHNLEGDERGDDLAHGPSIEEWDSETRETKLDQLLKESKVNNGKVGLFKISHIGGHKFAGNVIIYFPNGSCVWYGRVRPRDVGAVVEKTIVQGQVIPELLRGGLGLEGKTDGILAW